MDALKQANFCKLQMEQLHESVERYDDVARGRIGPPGGIKFDVYAGYETPKNAQVNKTAIKRQITSLRQSLLALEKEICHEA